MRRERKLSKDNGQFLYCLNEETDTSDCMVIRQMLRHSPDKRLRLMHPMRNVKYRVNTDFSFSIV